jgi:hypothetical protein
MRVVHDRHEKSIAVMTHWSDRQRTDTKPFNALYSVKEGGVRLQHPTSTIERPL